MKFLEYRTRKPIPDLPDSWPKEHLKPGEKIRIHLFGKGWRIYKIKKIQGGRVLVKKCWW